MNILYVLLAIIVFGLIVFVHELGHYLVGRKCGITILAFSIGFGPKLFSVKKGETEYSIRMIPLGGYCRFLGETEEDDPELYQSLKDPVAIYSVSPWKRFAMLFAGAGFNIIMAIVCISVFMLANGNYKPVVSEILPISFADEDGLQVGDVFLKVDGKTVTSYFEIADKLADANDIAEIVVERNNKTHKLVLQKVQNEDGAMLFGIRTTGKLERVGPIRAAYIGVRWIFNMTETIFEALGDVITGNSEEGALVGPVGTIDIIAQQVQDGWRSFILLLSMLSLNIGIFNLLPMPSLDGGRLVFVLYEIITGKRFSREKESAIHLIGIVLLLALIVFLTFKDVTALFK